MKLLVITQKIDKHDPILGFFHGWVEEFAKKVEKISIICLEKGEYNFPSNVSVFSLGKETGHTKFSYIIRFYKLIWDLRAEYEAVFVHMNQEYVLLAADMWRIMRKRVYLWRNHAKGNIFTIMAVWLSHKVFYTSPRSFTAQFSKAVQMPVGIDTDFFKPDPSLNRKPNSILFLGRIAPVKRVLEFIDWLEEKWKKGEIFNVTIAGEASARDKNYDQRVRQRVSESGFPEHVTFVGSVNQEGALKLYQTHETYVNLTLAGSLDKTILEAKACGMKVMVENSDARSMDVEGNTLQILVEKLKKEMS